MKGGRLVACWIMVLLLLGVFMVPAASADDGNCTGADCTGGGGHQHPIMYVDLKTIREWQREIDAQPVATAEKAPVLRSSAAVSLASVSAEAAGDSFSLLDYLDYVPEERDQGRCGNGWVWAGTGILEIAHGVNRGITDRLSIQYLNSKLNGGGPGSFACCGSGLTNYAYFYTVEGLAIPWSNTNGAFQDGNHCCMYSPGCSPPYDQTAVPAGTIGTVPHYQVANIVAETVETHGDDLSNEQAIQNIRDLLNANRGIYYSWCLADSADWDKFQTDFWDNEGEDALWDPSPYAGHAWKDGEGGCHAVLVAGYGTTDSNEDYWLMLNSWGTTPGRPNGIFRMKQDIDYDMTYVDTDGLDYYLMNWQTLDIEFNRPPVADAGGPYTGTEGSRVTFDASGSTDPDPATILRFRWDFTGDGNWDTDWSTDPVAGYTYCNNITTRVTLEVSDWSDDAGGPLTDTTSTEVTIREVPSTVDAGPDQEVNPGGTVQFQGTVTDPATCEPRSYAWNFGDGGTASGTLSPTHVYTRVGTYTVTLTVTDDGTPVSDTLRVKVKKEKLPPVVDAGTDQKANEGATVRFHGRVSGTDSGGCNDQGNDHGDGHSGGHTGDLTYAWDFGDGGTATGTLSPTHEYGREGTYTVTLTVTDGGGLSASDSLTVVVKNVNPSASIRSLEQPSEECILPGVHTLKFTGKFTDPGWLDTHTASWDFGDGTVLPGTVTEENVKPYSSGNTTAVHAYAVPGNYKVILTVTDDAQGTGRDTLKVRVFTAREALQELNRYVQTLPLTAFRGYPLERRRAAGSMIQSIDGKIEKKMYREAIQELATLRVRADGFMGGNPGDDWITGKTVQKHVCAKIDDLTAYLATLS